VSRHRSEPTTVDASTPKFWPTEVTYLLGTRLGADAEVCFLGDLAAGILLAESVAASDWMRIAELVATYRSLPLGTADASVIATAERRRNASMGRHVRSVSSIGIGSTECNAVRLGSPNPDDGRSSTIRLTRPGRRLLTGARRTFTDEVGIRLGEPLSTSELQRFAATVHRLRAHIHEQRRSA
jgi:hypothetical protein